MECAICLELNLSQQKHFECTHYFHDSCISKWNGTCPVCRSQKNIQCIHNYIIVQSGIPPYGKIKNCTICNDFSYI